MRWDIFCRVIDNYGDIGVCWRLAKQLAHQYGFTVRLWVDDLNSFQRLVPEIETGRSVQHIVHHSRRIEIRHWQAGSNAPGELADVVIEAFGCALPEAYVLAMAQRVEAGLAQAAWINLEYLSAEAWVETRHGLPSPHPQLPLTKHFFFPGFTQKTGGLLREKDLRQRRLAFQSHGEAQAAFWLSLGLPPSVPNELRISMFAYNRPETEQAFLQLLKHWANSPQCCTVLIAKDVLSDALSLYFGQRPQPGLCLRRGSLSVQVFAMLDQNDYDRLLWACDVNFVRGEDSFVRAQWAGRPFVWQIYPQQENAHRVKLDAFLDLFTQAWQANEETALRSFWKGWNNADSAITNGLVQAWLAFENQLPVLNTHAKTWLDQIGAGKDLAARLIHFVKAH